MVELPRKQPVVRLRGSSPFTSAKVNLDGLRSYVVQSAWFAKTISGRSEVETASTVATGRIRQISSHRTRAPDLPI